MLNRYRRIAVVLQVLGAFILLVALGVALAGPLVASERICSRDKLWPEYAAGHYDAVIAAVLQSPAPTACALTIAARATAAKGFCNDFGRPDDSAPYAEVLRTGAGLADRAVAEDDRLVDAYIEQAHTNGFLLRDFGAHGRTEKTLNALQHAVAVDPDNGEARAGLGLFQLGVAAEKTKGFWSRAKVWAGSTFVIADDTDQPGFQMNVAPEVALANVERGLADDPGSLSLAHAVVANWNKLLESRDGESAADLASSLGLPEFLDVVDAERRVIERAAREDGLTHYERCMICAVEPALRPNDCPPWAIPD